MEDEAAPGSPITIVIADDHQVVRAGLRLLLEAEEGFEVLAEAGARLVEGRCRGLVDQPQCAGAVDRLCAVVHPELLVGALGSFLCR